jgi:hypothetical protein
MGCLVEKGLTVDRDDDQDRISMPLCLVNSRVEHHVTIPRWVNFRSHESVDSSLASDADRISCVTSSYNYASIMFSEGCGYKNALDLYCRIYFYEKFGFSGSI